MPEDRQVAEPHFDRQHPEHLPLELDAVLLAEEEGERGEQVQLARDQAEGQPDRGERLGPPFSIRKYKNLQSKGQIEDEALPQRQKLRDRLDQQLDREPIVEKANRVK